GEAASHNFAAARDHAIRLTTLAPTKSYPFEILGDAQLELGQYEEAAATYAKLEQLAGSTVNTETRLARLAMLRGNNDDARDRFSKALQLAQELTPASPETVAWCQWQLGETAFAIGDYAAAEQYYHDALAAAPEYLQALASLGRVRAARGDLPGAIARYERAVEIDPMPVFVAALADLYQLAGQEKQAAMQRGAILDASRSAIDARLDNRQLVLFYADHDLRAGEAYAGAAREYEVRRDIYGADAVAWTALKAGKLREAQAAIQQALALGTRDARLFYHAGMIAKASGDAAACRQYLTRALNLNPHFDPLQSKLARDTLTQLRAHAQTTDALVR
ncbi:MAG: tetratricopeptide repeat protein, partial [Betaproteobacteria bacterium]|nr:tetratricopeptide repeat protein [Betaproteobacteria bacterium]